MESHEGIAHLLVRVLEFLNLLLQGLDGILLPIPVGSLGKPYLGAASLCTICMSEVMLLSFFNR